MDLASETLVPLTAVARRLTSARTGNALDLGTVRRWALRGVAGVKLATVLIGGTRYTSEEELRRWQQATAERRLAVPLTVPPRPKSRQRAERRVREWLGRT